MYAQELNLQLALFAAIAIGYIAAMAFIFMSKTRFRKWLGVMFVFGFSENVLAYPAALMGYEPFQWIVGTPATTRYLGLVALAMATLAGGFWVFSKNRVLVAPFCQYPALRFDTRSLVTLSLVLSFAGAIASIYLSSQGFLGYFTAEEYLYNPKGWFGIAKAALNACMGLSFIVFLANFERRGKLSVASCLLALGWTIAGITNAFKALVALPFVFIFFASWLAGRSKVRYVVNLMLAFVLAYTVVEPLREFRWIANTDNALAGISYLMFEKPPTVAETGYVLERMLNRMDYTGTAIETLEADQDGRLDEYKGRLRESYALLPALTFLPGSLWKDKPLADHGRVLSVALDGNEQNSITPSNVVASYLWLGLPGILINGAFMALFVVIAGRMMDRYAGRTLQYFPALFLMLMFAIQDSIMASRYVVIIRGIIGVAIFYAIARALGLTERPAPRQPLEPADASAPLPPSSISVSHHETVVRG